MHLLVDRSNSHSNKIHLRGPPHEAHIPVRGNTAACMRGLNSAARTHAVSRTRKQARSRVHT
eukprot:13929303-Alexandrium_andersonii.AAC.1